MEYEKKYNEAMLRADEAVQKGCLDKDMFDIIFPPEESEDERIRKWLADYFSSIKATVWIHRDITCEQILAWLEKQKERKPVMGNGISEQTKMDETVYKFTPEEWKKALDEQLPKEPKPAEWSEEDADILNCCISSIEEAKENRYAYKETDGDTSYDREIDWLKSLRPSWKPSEEQMEAFRGYLEELQARAEAAVGGWNNFDVMIRLYEHLKNL